MHGIISLVGGVGANSVELFKNILCDGPIEKGAVWVFIPRVISFI